jgi:phospholipid/cholesterol/gamma-HCH transport system permease protein
MAASAIRRKSRPRSDPDHAESLNGFVEIRDARGKATLLLTGRWTIENTAAIEDAIATIRRRPARDAYEVIGEGIERLDTSGALLLKRLLPDGELPRRLKREHRALLEFLPQFSEYESPSRDRDSGLRALFVRVGETAYASRDFLYGIVSFIGEVALCFFRNLRHLGAFRLPSLVRHTQETGLEALMIVGLLAVLISMVITYQGAVQLKKFGADIYTIDMMVVALLREMGVLVTAIMVAGRSGSAFAAEIGVMKLRNEIDALRTMGVDPIEVLVLPRVLALVVTLPLLTFLANVIGLAGGSVMSMSLLNTSFSQYFDRVEQVADFTMFFVGMIKAPVFAFIIAVIGCYQGMTVTGSAENIGRTTTVAVVQSIFVVIMADAVFSIVFSKVGI